MKVSSVSGFEKIQGLRQQQLWRFFGNIVAARQALARYIKGAFTPQAHHIKTLANRAMLAPEYTQRLHQTQPGRHISAVMHQVYAC
jgi:hypothetical protein